MTATQHRRRPRGEARRAEARVPAKREIHLGDRTRQDPLNSRSSHPSTIASEAEPAGRDPSAAWATTPEDPSSTPEAVPASGSGRADGRTQTQTQTGATQDSPASVEAATGAAEGSSATEAGHETASSEPMPVEPDGGIGDGAGPIPPADASDASEATVAAAEAAKADGDDFTMNIDTGKPPVDYNVHSKTNPSSIDDTDKIPEEDGEGGDASTPAATETEPATPVTPAEGADMSAAGEAESGAENESNGAAADQDDALEKKTALENDEKVPDTEDVTLPTSSKSEVADISNSHSQNHVKNPTASCGSLGCRMGRHPLMATSVMALLPAILAILWFKRKRARENDSRGEYRAVAAQYTDMRFDNAFTDDYSSDGDASFDDDDLDVEESWGKSDSRVIEMGNLKDDERNGGLSLEEMNG